MDAAFRGGSSAGQRPVASARVLVAGLRSLLRFLFLAGRIGQQLAWAAPAPAGFAGGGMIRGVTASAADAGRPP